MNVVRKAVSKKKKRFVDESNGFNLDLAYVTPRIIAMGYPSTGVEAVYRNPMPEVQRFFKLRHEGHFKVYNLCSERIYNVTDYFPQVEHFGFTDHNPCALQLLKPFCESVDKFLAESPENVVAIHCKAGKVSEFARLPARCRYFVSDSCSLQGRTGLVIAAYLYHAGICPTVEAALEHFAENRTHNCKGVTIPSQMRMVHYYAQTRKEVHPRPPKMLLLTHVRLIKVPRFDSSVFGGGGCTPYFTVQLMKKTGELQWEPKTIYNYKKMVGDKFLQHATAEDEKVELDCSSHYLKVKGDVKLIFYTTGTQKDVKMYHLWFNTAFVPDNGFLRFPKAVVDKACKDKHNKHFDDDFEMQLFFHQITDDGKGSILVPNQDEASLAVKEEEVEDEEDEVFVDSDEEHDDLFVSASAMNDPSLISSQPLYTSQVPRSHAPSI
jgi:phosphatidylinositol-3,4,5-trisphosphate 3-phosphatase/dual-specificity protein phosphatase PTEN